MTAVLLPYWALTRASVRSALRYRSNFYMGMVGTIFQLVALLAVWRVLLADGPIGGFTWPQMQVYLLVTFTCGMVVSMMADWRMAYRIESGMVALDLVKPVNYQTARFAEIGGGVLLELGLAAVVWLVVIVAGDGLPVPSPGRLALFAVSLLLVVHAVWTVALWVFGLWAFRTAIRRLTVHGG